MNALVYSVGGALILMVLLWLLHVRAHTRHNKKQPYWLGKTLVCNVCEKKFTTNLESVVEKIEGIHPANMFSFDEIYDVRCPNCKSGCLLGRYL